MPSGGELWPGGPVELPARVRVCDEDYTIGAAPVGRLAYLIATSLWIVPGLLVPEDRERVNRRLACRDDPLDRDELEEASLFAAARLAGVRRGVSGWRVAVRLCTALVMEWEQHGTGLLAAGVDVTGPLWRVAGHMYALAVNDPAGDEAKRNAAAGALVAPLPWEPEWLRVPERVATVSRARQRASNRSFYEQFTGRTVEGGVVAEGAVRPAAR